MISHLAGCRRPDPSGRYPCTCGADAQNDLARRLDALPPAPCLGCAKVRRHPGEGYVRAAHPDATPPPDTPLRAAARPGPGLGDSPKDVQFASADYTPKEKVKPSHYAPRVKGDIDQITRLVEMLETAERPVFYTGGGVINSGRAASQLLRELVEATGFPITSTLMGLGAYPASGKNWLGMLGMHGTYEANMAMHDCDVMINIGARFDDRITGRLDAFSHGPKKIHVDNDASRGLIDLLKTDAGTSVPGRFGIVVISKSGGTLEKAVAFRQLLAVLGGTLGKGQLSLAEGLK